MIVCCTCVIICLTRQYTAGFFSVLPYPLHECYLSRSDVCSRLSDNAGTIISPPSPALWCCRDVNWGFLMILYGAKVLVFGIVVLVTAVASYPTSLGRAGLYGIFCTQSNDFALGYPLGMCMVLWLCFSLLGTVKKHWAFAICVPF